MTRTRKPPGGSDDVNDVMTEIQVCGPDAGIGSDVQGTPEAGEGAAGRALAAAAVRTGRVCTRTGSPAWSRPLLFNAIYCSGGHRTVPAFRPGIT